MKTALALLAFLVPTRLSAQWPDQTWWHGTINCHSVMCAHPIPHLLGGAGLDGASYVFVSGTHPVKRCFAVGLVQGMWEGMQMEVGPSNPYPVRYAVADVATSVLACAVVEGAVALVRK